LRKLQSSIGRPAWRGSARSGVECNVYQPEFDPERSGAVAVGVDIIEIARIKRVLDDFGERFLRRVYTEAERERYRNRVNELAARFAAKEATSKALGTGIRGIRWREMEVLPNRRGKPVLILHGQAAARAAELELTDFSVSLTHSRTDAMAFVVAMKAQRVAEPTPDGLAQAIQRDTQLDGGHS
jgi:holo-[acyl-carrier protein] synthase